MQTPNSLTSLPAPGFLENCSEEVTETWAKGCLFRTPFPLRRQAARGWGAPQGGGRDRHRMQDAITSLSISNLSMAHCAQHQMRTRHSKMQPTHSASSDSPPWDCCRLHRCQVAPKTSCTCHAMSHTSQHSTGWRSLLLAAMRPGGGMGERKMEVP